MRKLKIKRFQPPRCLRSYRRWSSERERTCWNCQFPIEIGDPYDAEVWICPAGPVRFCVHTMHLECPYGDFYEQEEQDLFEMEDGEEQGNDEAIERAA